MCGKGIHQVRLLDDVPICYMDYFCDNGACNKGEPQCPHKGEDPCTCDVNRISWEDIVDLLHAKLNEFKTKTHDESFLEGFYEAIAWIEAEADHRDWTRTV